jgi:acetoin utilization deacetylase AcuC-like enzyme
VNSLQDTSPAFKLLYSPKYQVDIGRHVFPTNKYHLIYQRLLKDRLFKEDDFIIPAPASEEDILLAHTKEYVDKLFQGRLSTSDIIRLELPYSKELVEASRICVEGTIQCLRYAVKDGISVHIGGGFHHAFADHGEGFCVFNDIAIGIKNVQKLGLVKKVLVVDCDLHHGNGTAAIFSGDKSIFTFSIHQQNNYPLEKPPSNIDVGLDDGTGDSQYLSKLREYIPDIFKEFKPEFALYVAGADPYKGDQLGGLSLTIDGLKKRDEFIFGLCKRAKVPVAAVLAGGYAINLDDTVTIHYNMIKTAKEIGR